MMTVNSKVENVANQNCVKPTEKVEPKFKVGDWVVVTIKSWTTWSATYQILNVDIDKKLYQTGDNTYLRFESEKNMRLWTIEDEKDYPLYAKDGKWRCSREDYIKMKKQ